MVRRGAATFVNCNGSTVISLRFIDDVERRRSLQAEAARRSDASITADRAGVICWDGCSPGSRTIPVPRVPFEASPFKSPAQIGGSFNPLSFNGDRLPAALRGEVIVHNKLFPPLRRGVIEVPK